MSDTNITQSAFESMSWASKVAIALNAVSFVANEVVAAAHHSLFNGGAGLFNGAVVGAVWWASLKLHNNKGEIKPVIQMPSTATSQVIIAYRAWKLGPNATLLPMAFDGPSFKPRQRLAAKIKPEPNGQDGIHAFKTVEAVVQSYGDQVFSGSVVLARVALWGVVQCHTEGYRAQYAYPQMFFNIPGLPRRDDLANRWGVETGELSAQVSPWVDEYVNRQRLQVFHAAWDQYREPPAAIPILDREEIIAREQARHQWAQHQINYSHLGHLQAQMQSQMMGALKPWG